MSELKKITATMHIIAYRKSWRHDDGSAYYTTLSSYLPESKDSDRINLGTIDVDYEIPTDDAYFDEKQIEVLKAKKQRIIADSRMKQQKIDDEINSLLALPHLEAV